MSPPAPRTEDRPAKVLIVDDHPAVREALASRIDQQHDLQVCGEAADSTEALRLITSQDPDVAIIDIGLKNGNGIDLIKRVKAHNYRVAMIVWSMHGESLYAERALRAGAVGYITKEQATDKIIAAIRQVRNGKTYISEDLSADMMERIVGRANSRTGVETLSDRELQAFELLGHGLTTEEIAAKMHISPKTVETYRVRIKEKLRIVNINELLRHAVQWVTLRG